MRDWCTSVPPGDRDILLKYYFFPGPKPQSQNANHCSSAGTSIWPVLAFGQWLAFSDCGFSHTRTGRYIWLWANVDFSDYKLPFCPGLGLKNAHLTCVK